MPTAAAAPPTRPRLQSPDGKSFTVAFTQFTVSVDENTSADSKDCLLGISVSAPDGQSYALLSLDMKGSATRRSTSRTHTATPRRPRPAASSVTST